MRLKSIFLYLWVALSVAQINVHAQNNWILAPRVNNASDIIITAATTTSLTFNWTDGNYGNRIVVMKSGSAVNSNPVNGVSYTPSLIFGSGTQIGTGNYVVRIGSGPITVTGLTQGIIYYIAVYEFNGSGGSESYLTTNPATGYGAATSTEYAAVLSYATGQGWTLPSVPQQQFATIYVNQLVTSGLWAKKRVIWIPATDGDRNFAKINYKDPGNFTLTESGTPTFTTNSGFSSQDLASYLDTGWKPTTNAGGLFSQNSCHFTLGIGGFPDIILDGNYLDFGVSGAALSNGIYCQSGIANTQVNIRLNSAATVGKIYDGLPYGYVSGIRRTATANTLFRQKNYVIDNVSHTSNAVIDQNLYMCAVNQNGTAAFFSKRSVATLQLGTELTSTDAFNDKEYWNQYYESILGLRTPINTGPFTTYSSISIRVIATRDNYQFATDGYNLRFSSDNGSTWTIYPWGCDFCGLITPISSYITGAHIWANGTLTFATASTLYRSTNGLATAPSVITPQVAGGGTYNLHTPTNVNFPGNYFGFYDVEPIPSTITGGAEILVWGSYNNTSQGAAPGNIFYSIDNGATIKTFYTFGQNPNYRDDGTLDGGTTGTLLGNAGSTLKIRHVHSVTRNPGTLDWYACTGDDAPTSEVMWLKFTYNDIADTWSAPTVLYNGTTPNGWKSINIHFEGATPDLYYATDGGAGGLLGVYRTTIGNIGGASLGTRLLATTDNLAGFRMNVNTGFLIALPTTSYIFVAQNFGATYYQYTIPGAHTSDARMGAIAPKDSRGYYKFNAGGFYGLDHFVKTVWIKENQ